MTDPTRAPDHPAPGDAVAGREPGGDAPPPSPERRPMTMADYERAMTERNQHARARGLAAPYIRGGEDPDPTRGRAEERHYLRLLLLMVGAIVIGGFAISIIALILTGPGS